MRRDGHEGPQASESVETDWAKAWRCRQHKGTKSNEVKQKASMGLRQKATGTAAWQRSQRAGEPRRYREGSH